LVVDDEASILNSCRQALESMGFGVFAASSGEAAIALFREHHMLIGWVLLDLTMPGLNGVQTYEQLIRIASEPRVIFSSGYSRTALSDRPDIAKATGFLEKPYLREHLRRMLLPQSAPNGPSGNK